MRWKNSIVSLRLRFLEIPHKKVWVSWGVLFKGLGVQKGTQTPCWLRPWYICILPERLAFRGLCVQISPRHHAVLGPVTTRSWYDLKCFTLELLACKDRISYVWTQRSLLRNPRSRNLGRTHSAFSLSDRQFPKKTPFRGAKISIKNFQFLLFCNDNHIFS